MANNTSEPEKVKPFNPRRTPAKTPYYRCFNCNWRVTVLGKGKNKPPLPDDCPQCHGRVAEVVP